NEAKTKFMNYKNHFEVTGLIIKDNSISVSRKYIKNLEQELYYIEKYGLKDHKEKRNIRNLFYPEHLIGCIKFVKWVDTNKGNKLENKLNDLIERGYFSNSNLPNI